MFLTNLLQRALMNFNQVISFPSYIMFQEFDNESILLDIRSQEHFALDAIGSLFFSQVSKGASTQESFEKILNLYEVSKEQLEKDLDNLLQQLLKYELIEVK